VSAYLNDYKNQTDPKKQDEYSRKFTCYLLSTCWRKIFRRVTSWRAIGFIRFLTMIPRQELQNLQWDQFPSHIEPGDKTLMDFLRHSENPPRYVENSEKPIQSLLLDHIPTSSNIDQLLGISRRSKSLADPAPLFSAETILEFHSLVIGAFRGFANAFLQIKEEFSKLVRMDYQALEM
jgi:hypothetical protein